MRRLLAHSGADYVVHNDLAARQPDGTFPADIIRADGTVVTHCPDRATLAAALEQLLAADAGANYGMPAKYESPASPAVGGALCPDSVAGDIIPSGRKAPPTALANSP